VSHDDELRHLDNKFQNNRYTNFGPILQSLAISGFRGVKELHLELKSPITALSGLNGTGKSTVAQLACCGYRKGVTAAVNRYYVKDFFPVSAADPAPFRADGRVVYSYCVEGNVDARQVTVSRKAKEWSGYKRQPERSAYYIGFTQFIPKVERRDFSVYGGRLLMLGTSRALIPEAARNVSTILGLPYEHLDFTEVNHGTRTAELAMATRHGQRYSENHMGFGEGRVVYMVNTMESAPAQSLFVLEEPETSLHGDAQRRLAQYFVQVAERRGHQMIITTHSSAILGQLGRESKLYLRREPDGAMSATTGLSTYQVDSYLSQYGNPSAALVCVEDDFAEHLAIEIIRRCDNDLLSGCTFLSIGGGQEIPKAVGLLRKAGMRVAGLSDGDMGHDGTGGVMSLPGARPPEVEVFSDPAVKFFFAGTPYATDLDTVLAPVHDHHQHVGAIARHLMVDESVITTEACRAYVTARDPSDFDGVMRFLSQELGDRR
jgi:predicted ATPase